MILKNVFIVMAVCIVMYAKNTIMYCLDLISRDSIFNYLIDQKTMINSLFCKETDYTVFISPLRKERVTKK